MEYRFLEIIPMYGSVSVITIKAGCENDAWELLDEVQHNFGSYILLDNIVIGKLKSVVRTLK